MVMILEGGLGGVYFEGVEVFLDFYGSIVVVVKKVELDFLFEVEGTVAY